MDTIEKLELYSFSNRLITTYRNFHLIQVQNPATREIVIDVSKRKCDFLLYWKN